MFIGSGLVFFVLWVVGLIYLFKDLHWVVGLIGIFIPIIPVIYLPYRFLAHNLPDSFKVPEGLKK
jgi:hypothetical protein